jgi:outer membrane protein OmpA-like peptidoglycan-associated protein
MNDRTTRLQIVVTMLMLGLAAGAATAQQDLRASLFTLADEAMQVAREARADVLAPRSYGDAMEHYQDAEENLRRGRSIERIQRDLDRAVESFRKATEASSLAVVTLASAIQARDDAEEANAAVFASDQWKDAESKFAFAATRLEGGNVNSARSRADVAETSYRQAELTAIKANYLDETRRLIAQADDDRVDRYAPKTLAKAQALLAQAETALTTNRYDTDEPRNIARQAKYEVLHAMHLAKVLKPVRDRDVSLEDFALVGESAIVAISSKLDFAAELDQGYDPATAKINEQIDRLQKDSYELGERRVQIEGLEAEILALEQQLGTQSQRLALQEERRQKIRQVEAMFAPGEAEVFTQGPNLLIRPVGLVFPTGTETIQTQYFGILRKLQDAIRVFPNSTVLIEGHTDSFGSDATNLTLSEKRALAVREYLLANMQGVSPGDFQAIGYGESRPAANNETVEGRAKNRRIDLIIRPKADQ